MPPGCVRDRAVIRYPRRLLSPGRECYSPRRPLPYHQPEKDGEGRGSKSNDRLSVGKLAITVRAKLAFQV